MRLPLLERQEEISRLEHLVGRRESSLGVLYGRRRCGKSRLLREVLPEHRTVYSVGAPRESALQRSSTAVEIGRILPGFDHTTYPSWEALLNRWWSEAPPGSVLAFDEFPTLATAAPELPGLLQKSLALHRERRLHLVLTGSSLGKMQSLVLHRTAPLFGQAAETLKINPLSAGWIRDALPLGDPTKALEAFSVWGGIPHYWELAADHQDLKAAVRALVLNPSGVLYEESARLLLDDLRDTSQAASILSLIGQGYHRASEIAKRLEKPATSLSRPLQRLVQLGLLHREIPFGTPAQSGKRSLYRIADPFLRYWFRLVEPHRSLLESHQLEAAEQQIATRFDHHVAGIWAELARASAARLKIFGKTWGPAAPWWGLGSDRQPLEIDLVAESVEGDALLVGELKWTAERNAELLLHDLVNKAKRLPCALGREILPCLWLKTAPRGWENQNILTPEDVLAVLC